MAAIVAGSDGGGRFVLGPCGNVARRQSPVGLCHGGSISLNCALPEIMRIEAKLRANYDFLRHILVYCADVVLEIYWTLVCVQACGN